MTTSQIVWIVVIAVAVLILIGLIVSVRKKNQDANRARASQLREQADIKAAVLPDTRARADQAEAQAERARVEAEHAEERSAALRAEAEQERAAQEDRIRAADRLDPDVDHQAEDYSPQVADPAGPSNVPTDPAYADPATGRVAETSPTSPTATDDTDGSSVTLEQTDTSPRDTTIGTDSETLRNRLEGDAPERTDETTRGAHRA